MPPSPPLLLEIEERLAADPPGIERDRLLHELGTSRQKVRRALAQGAPPEEFRKLSVLVDALDASERVLAALWKHLNWREGRHGP